MPHPNYNGPYRVGTIGDGAQIMRHNDGSMIVMGLDDVGDNCPAVIIPMRVHAKRGEAWRTTDHEQEAFAAFVVDTLNAAFADSKGS